LKKNILRFTSVRKPLRVTLLCAISFVLSYNFYLEQKPGFIPYAYQFGKLFYTLSLSYISAFIFFYINLHISSFNNKVKGHTFVHNKARKVIRLNTELIHALINYGKMETKLSGEEKFSKALIQECCKIINPYKPIKVNGIKSMYFPDWFMYFNYQHKEIKEVILAISQQTLLNDDELIEIMIKLENQFDTYLNRFKGEKVNFEEDNLDFFSDGIIGYSNIIQELERRIKELSKYQVS
jgi:hypothetical protein